MLDFAVSDASFGKPSGGADLRLGLATAPTLYAWEEFEEMGPLIERRFEGQGDVELVRFLSPLLSMLADPCLGAYRLVRLSPRLMVSLALASSQRATPQRRAKC